jgi:hypothetical protein
MSRVRHCSELADLAVAPARSLAAHAGAHLRRQERLEDRCDRPHRSSTASSWLIEGDPHVLVHADGRFVLDNDYWLNDGDGRTFLAEVRRRFRDHPQRRLPQPR